MNFWYFVFGFLFTRDWHTGQRELSRPRVALFGAGVFLVVLALLLVAYLQAPVVYLSPIQL